MKPTMTAIEKTTGIWVIVVAGRIIDEIATYADSQGFTAEADTFYAKRKLYERFLSIKAERIYAHNRRWRTLINRRRPGSSGWPQGLESLYSFMRHWMCPILDKRHHAIYRIIPEGFRVGERIIIA